MRNSTLADSVMANFLARIRSCCMNLGPWIWLRTRLPNVPGFGIAKAAGLRIVRSLLRNGSTPGTRSGRRTLRELPPPGVLMTAVRPAAGSAVEDARRVHVDDVRARDLHGDRQAAAHVDDACPLPNRQAALLPTSAEILRPANGSA